MTAHLGLDIGSQIIKVVKTSGTKVGSGLELFGMFPTPANALLSDAPQDGQQVAEAVKKLLDKLKVKQREVVLALPENKLYSRVVTMPKLSESELASAIKYEAEQYVPISTKELTLGWQILTEKSHDEEEEQLQVLLIAAPNSVVDKYQKIAEMAELKPVAIESGLVAIARSLGKSNGYIMIVDMGGYGTDIGIVKNQELYFARTVPVGGITLTRAIAQDLNLDINQAEEYKVAYGLEAKELEGNVRNAILPVIRPVLAEVKKTVAFFESKWSVKIKQVLLTGGGSSLRGLASELVSQVQAEIVSGDPFSAFVDAAGMKKIPADAVRQSPYLATAVGLALKPV